MDYPFGALPLIGSARRFTVERLERPLVCRPLKAAAAVIRDAGDHLIPKGFPRHAAIAFEEFKDSVCEFVAPHGFGYLIHIGQPAFTGFAACFIDHRIRLRKVCYGFDRGWRGGQALPVLQDVSQICGQEHPQHVCGDAAPIWRFMSPISSRRIGNPGGEGCPGRAPRCSPRADARGRDASYQRALQIIGDVLGVVALLAMVFGVLMFPGGM